MKVVAKVGWMVILGEFPVNHSAGSLGWYKKPTPAQSSAGS